MDRLKLKLLPNPRDVDDREQLINLTVSAEDQSSGSANFADGVLPYLDSVDIAHKILIEVYNC